MADERLDDNGRNKLLGLLDAGEPHGEVRTAWHAKKSCAASTTITILTSRSSSSNGSAKISKTARVPSRTAHSAAHSSAGRTRIAAWHRAHVTNGPTEAAIIWSPNLGVIDVAHKTLL